MNIQRFIKLKINNKIACFNLHFIKYFREGKDENHSIIKFEDNQEYEVEIHINDLIEQINLISIVK
jgi:hypothetical protein